MAYLSTRRRRRIDPLAAAFDLQNRLAMFETGARYNDALAGLQSLRDRVMAAEAEYGDAAINDTNKRWDTGLKTDLSDLASRGLSGSSLRLNATEANRRGRSDELRRVNDNITDRRINADERRTEALYDEMRGRTDMQPNFNQLASLSQGLGQAGYLSGGSYNPIGYGQPGGGQLMSPIMSPGLGPRQGIGLQNSAGYGAARPLMQVGLGPRQGIGMQNSAGYLGTRPTMQIDPGPRQGMYQPPGQTASGLDDVSGASIDRFNNQLAWDSAFNNGYLGGGLLGMGGSGNASYSPMRVGNRFNVDAPQRQYRSSDPSGDAQRAIVATGADPWVSTPNNLVFPSPGAGGSFGDPRAFGRPKVVQGAATAGDNVVVGNPITGTGGGYSSYGAGDQDGGMMPYGAGYFGGRLSGVNPAVALAAARNSNNNARMLSRRAREIQRGAPFRAMNATRDLFSIF